MNQNQEKIKSQTQAIFSSLALLGDAVTAFRSQREKINSQEHTTQKGKEEQIAKIRAELEARFRETYSNTLTPRLQEIRETAEEMERKFEISPELSAAIALVTSAGDKIEFETANAMWRQFIGSRHALVSLRSLFESKGVTTAASGIDRYIISAESFCNDLDGQALAFYTQPGTNLNQMVKLGQMLEDFCEKEGVQLDKPFVQYLGAEDYSEYMTEQLREAFGI